MALARWVVTMNAGKNSVHGGGEFTVSHNESVEVVNYFALYCLQMTHLPFELRGAQ